MLIVGLSGATCSGKTTIALEIQKLLPNIHVISQDDYFRAVNDPKHTWIPELNHINFDIVSSLDMEKMHLDIQNYIFNKDNTCPNKHFSGMPANLSESLCELQEKIKNSYIDILIIEGFCIFNYRPVSDLCDLKYFLTLSKEECFNRRSKRVYEPPDCPGYFEICAWPEYENLLAEVQNYVKDVRYIDNGAGESTETVLKTIMLDITNHCMV